MQCFVVAVDTFSPSVIPAHSWSQHKMVLYKDNNLKNFWKKLILLDAKHEGMERPNTITKSWKNIFPDNKEHGKDISRQ